MAVYGYTRVSTDEQVKGSSLSEQAKKIEAIAALRDSKVKAIFTDGGVSGSVDFSERPEGSKLISILKKGDVLVVAKLDRLFRSANNATSMIDDFKAKGIALVICDFGTDDVCSNGIARMMTQLLSVVAEFERGMIKERQQSGISAKKSRQGHTGGSRPFGFKVIGKGKDAVLKPIQKEQRIIAEIKAAKASGLSLRKIASAMNEKHDLTLSHNTVSRILKDDLARH